MPHRDLLSIAQRAELFKLPTALRQLEEYYTLTPADLDLVARRRLPQNRLGFAVLLCFLRYPGWAWTPDQNLPEPILRFIASQIGVAPEGLSLYAERDETRREHMLELQTAYGWQTLSRALYREVTDWLKEQARSTDQGVALATVLIGELRRRRIVVPTFPVLERLALVARALARRETYLKQRSEQLHTELQAVEQLAKAGALPDVSITDGVLKITPLDNQEPDETELLMRQAYSLVPLIKITDLLVEVDNWTGFTKHFTNLRSGETVKERSLLLTTILADGINLGITRMAEACPGISASTLSRIATWNIREETYTKALAEIVNHHHARDFAEHWGEGTTSSSDGQRFKTGGHAEARGEVNARYGNDPGATFYTHISDQYAPFYTKLINATVRDATHVLDGLLYHESELQIEEHYTDTAGFTDHVFGLCHLLGFRFAPRIRNVGDTKLFTLEKASTYPTLEKLIGGKLNTQLIATHWDEILRLAASIKQGTVTASLMLRKLGAYPRQNGLAVALREFGKIERTLFLLQYIRDPELRRRIHVGLNKGEAKNALARAVFFNRLGELRDRTHENQRNRASGLNLVVAAIVLWNTVYLEKAVTALQARGQVIPEGLLSHLSPLKWEHINLTGDYHWPKDSSLVSRELRPLRSGLGTLLPTP